MEQLGQATTQSRRARHRLDASFRSLPFTLECEHTTKDHSREKPLWFFPKKTSQRKHPSFRTERATQQPALPRGAEQPGLPCALSCLPLVLEEKILRNFLRKRSNEGHVLFSSTCRCDISSPSRLCLTHVWLEVTSLRIPGPHSSAPTVGSGERIPRTTAVEQDSRMPRPDGAGQKDAEEAGQENKINLTTHLHINILRCN